MNNLHILKASGRLETFEEKIRSGFERGIEKVKIKLELPNVDIVVEDSAEDAIPETGVGGYSPTAHQLFINIDPMHPGLAQTLEQEIQHTLAHELHHCARWNTVGYGKTLLEAVVSEGLADHFDLEINVGEPPLWSMAVQGEKLAELRKKAEPEFFNPKYNSRAWLFGSEEENIPRWTGYALGFQIVGDYMQKTGKTAAMLVNTKAEEFLK